MAPTINFLNKKTWKELESLNALHFKLGQVKGFVFFCTNYIDRRVYIVFT